MSRIVIVSDVTKGGAGVACLRLRQWLEAASPNHEFIWLAGSGSAARADIVVSERAGMVPLLLCRAFDRLQPLLSYRLRSWRRVVYRRANEHDLMTCLVRLKPDLVHLNNLHEFVSFRFVECLPRHVPLVWTLHDMWPLTGYCFCSMGCDSYVEGCVGECPQEGQWGPVYRRPEREWRRRQRFFVRRASQLTFTSPSNWLATCARRRLGPGARVHVLPHGLDVGLFRPRPREDVRRALGLPVDRQVVLAGPLYGTLEMKGTSYLFEAVRRLGQSMQLRPHVVAFGSREENPSVPSDWLLLDGVQDEELMALYFAAADVFLLPSLSEAFGQMYLEAASCGTPCVAFDTTAVPEIVRDGVTGYLARCRDVPDLVRCVKRVLEADPERRDEMRRRCREVAVTEYGHSLAADRYIALYENLLADTSRQGWPRATRSIGESCGSPA